MKEILKQIECAFNDFIDGNPVEKFRDRRRLVDISRSKVLTYNDHARTYFAIYEMDKLGSSSDVVFGVGSPESKHWKSGDSISMVIKMLATIVCDPVRGSEPLH